MRIGEVLTMAEYINRDDLLKAAWDKPTLSLSVYDIGNIKPVDVAPVRHGRGIETPRLYYGAKQYECSLCYSDTFWNKHSIYEKYPHCPNCGCKMDLEG